MDYNWQRRWLPIDLGGQAHEALSIPARTFRANWELRASSEGESLEALRHVPCLILLGEPGMGKTYALRREHASVDDSLLDGSVRTRHVDLAGSQNAENFRAIVFGNDVYRAWKTGSHRLILFIDSVDQSLTPVDQVIGAICNELDGADISRIQLRLVCRDYDWSLSLADALAHCWRNADGAPVRVYQLRPLTNDDIRLAAAANGKDPDGFLELLQSADAQPLATVPVTLQMLLPAEELTDSRVRLYLIGILKLCRRPDESVNLKEKARVRRFEMASRIAAIMILGGRDAVNIDGNADLTKSSIGIAELLKDEESEDEESLLRETLKCPLFQGTARRRWAHQTFAEYLAACFLSRACVSIKQIEDLVKTPDDKLARPLHEMLRWLAEMRADFLTEAVKREPMLLLKSDLSHLSENEYRRFAKSLLSLDDPYIYSNKTWDLRSIRASHPSAGRVLLPYLLDNEAHVYLRRFVLRLLECSGYPKMDDELVELALNEYEEYVLRCSAARGIWKAGSVEAKLALKPYAFGVSHDQEDELKGYALRALWPGHLTAEELFSALLPPKMENFWGSYRVFLLEQSVMLGLRAEDLPVALKWVAEQPWRHKMSIALNDIPDKIMRRAWGHRHLPGVQEAFAKTAVAKALARFDGIFGPRPHTYPADIELDECETAFIQDTQYRRELALKCLPHLVEGESQAWRLARTRPPIVVPEDLDWLLGHLESETDETRRGQLAELVASVGRENIDKLYAASERHPEVLERTKRFFESRLDDPDVISDREHFYKMKEIDERQDRQLAEVRPFEILADALDRIEAGQILQWLNVIYALLHNADGASESWDFKPDLSDFPLWNLCDTETHGRIRRAAETFVLKQNIDSSTDEEVEWYVSGSVSYVELYGYLAVYLLLKQKTHKLTLISKERWQRWSKIIVWFPLAQVVINDGRKRYHENTQVLQHYLLSRLYTEAPRALLENLRDLLLANDSHAHYLGQELAKVEHIWDRALEETLLELLRSSRLSAKGQGGLLEFLLKRDSAVARDYAQQKNASGHTDDDARAVVVEFCAGLMQSASPFDWNVVWSAIESDEEVGKAIVETVAKGVSNTTGFADHLSASKLADLVMWLEQHYPTGEDPQIAGFHVASNRENVASWRTGLLSQLRAKENSEALPEIQRILDRFPHLEGLQHTRAELEESVTGSDWQPVSPSRILMLLEPEERRVKRLSRRAIQFVKTNWKWIAGFGARHFMGSP